MTGSSVRIALSALVLLGLAACGGVGGTVSAGYTQMSLSGDIALAPTAGGVSLGSIQQDVESALGLDDPSGSPYLRGDVNAAIVTFTASAFQYDQSGTGTLTANFGNISAGTQVRSDMELWNLQGAALFELLNLGPVRFAPGLGVNYFTGDIGVASLTGPSISENVSIDAPLPLLYGEAEVALGTLRGIVDIGWISGEYGDVDGTFLDLAGTVRLELAKHAELFAGYRWIEADVKGTVDGQAFQGDLVLQGWFLGGSLRF